MGLLRSQITTILNYRGTVLLLSEWGGGGGISYRTGNLINYGSDGNLNKHQTMGYQTYKILYRLPTSGQKKKTFQNCKKIFLSETGNFSKLAKILHVNTKNRNYSTAKEVKYCFLPLTENPRFLVIFKGEFGVSYLSRSF
jgi:hypothetical protein